MISYSSSCHSYPAVNYKISCPSWFHGLQPFLAVTVLGGIAPPPLSSQNPHIHLEYVPYTDCHDTSSRVRLSIISTLPFCPKSLSSTSRIMPSSSLAFDSFSPASTALTKLAVGRCTGFLSPLGVLAPLELPLPLFWFDCDAFSVCMWPTNSKMAATRRFISLRLVLAGWVLALELRPLSPLMPFGDVPLPFKSCAISLNGVPLWSPLGWSLVY